MLLLLLLLLLQVALTAVALGQLDQLKALPGGAEGLLELLKDCPIMAEVRCCCDTPKQDRTPGCLCRKPPHTVDGG